MGRPRSLSNLKWLKGSQPFRWDLENIRTHKKFAEQLAVVVRNLVTEDASTDSPSDIRNDEQEK